MDVANDEPEHESEAESRTTARRVGYWVAVVAISFVLVQLVAWLLATPFSIPGTSMIPTIEPGDRVIVYRLSYVAGDVERGQVVVFDRPPTLPGDDAVIKRVIGLPGEVVRFLDDDVYIDEQLLVEPYLQSPSTTDATANIPGCGTSSAGARQCLVPEGHVFVLGDNRASSVDSRDYGPVPIDDIIGRAGARIWPPSGIKRL